MYYFDYFLFIDVVDIEILVMFNIIVESKVYSCDKGLMMVISISGKVMFGNDSFLVEFICFVGSKININCMFGILFFLDWFCVFYCYGGVFGI